MQKIGVFDSGIGGATVLSEILRVLPGVEYIYYSDSANNPYGDKTPGEIQKLSLKAVEYLLEEGCEAVVIACNTASANAADYLRGRFPDLPIVAIEPAYKMVHDYAFDGPTLVLATDATLHSEKFARLYHEYDNARTELVNCSGLAELIESERGVEMREFLRTKLGEYNGKVRNVVLGCTHYPLATGEIAEVLGEDVEFFNGAAALARHLKEVLSERGIIRDEDGDGIIDMPRVMFHDTSGAPEKEIRFRKIIDSVV